MNTQSYPSSRESTCAWVRKRPKGNPFPLNLVTTVFITKKKHPQAELARTGSSLQFTRNSVRRPVTSQPLQSTLTIVGKSHLKFYDTQVKHQKLQINIKKKNFESRCGHRSQSSNCSLPKRESILEIHYNAVDHLLCRNSAKLQKICNGADGKCKSMVLILTVEFILQQGRFWAQDQIEEDVVKTWRKLQSMAVLVWVIKRERSYKKIKAFSQKMMLSPDYVYLLRKPKKKKVITVNLKSVEVDLEVKTSQRLMYIDTVGEVSQMQYSDFLNKFPVSQTHKVGVHFLQTQQSAKQLFNSVPTLLLKEGTVTLEVQPVLNSYLQYLSEYQNERLRKKHKKAEWVQKSQPDEEQDYDQVILKRMEQLKGRWIKDIVNHFRAKNKQLPGQKQSIHYKVGDLLKRNFGIMGDIKSSSVRNNEQSPPPVIPYQQLQLPKELNYGIPIFLWKF